jgi:hypothetical protein
METARSLNADPDLRLQRIHADRTLTMRPKKITLREMRASGSTRLIVYYCGDYKCAYSVVIDAGRWGDAVRISDLEPKFTCQVCGHRGAGYTRY